MPYLLKLADMGVGAALRSDPGFLQGLNVHEGRVTHPAVASELGYEVLPVEQVLAG